MTINQNPFSVYDFLGYLVPGIFSIIGVFVALQNPNDFSIENISKITGYEQYLIILLICYLIGHILSFLSSITIEKYSIWTLGYPSKYLFNKARNGFWKSITSKYESKHRISSIIRIIFRISIKLGIVLFLLPISLCDIVIRHLLRLFDQYARPMDKDLMNVVRDKVNNLLKDQYGVEKVQASEKDDHDYFRLVYHYAIENAPNHVNKMQNYVALYGFIRTSSLITVIMFWVMIINYSNTNNLTNYWYYIVIIGVMSFILYLDFNKFYRKFSLEAFMATTVSIKPKSIS